MASIGSKVTLRLQLQPRLRQRPRSKDAARGISSCGGVSERLSSPRSASLHSPRTSRKLRLIFQTRVRFYASAVALFAASHATTSRRAAVSLTSISVPGSGCRRSLARRSEEEFSIRRFCGGFGSGSGMRPSEQRLSQNPG